MPRMGRDVHGLYPGQLARVYTVHAADRRFYPHSGTHLSLQESSELKGEREQPSFDILALRALSQRSEEKLPPQTTYQEHFGSPSPSFHPC
ncbi:hypothetical protein OJAV_G00009950 [Oryzias javanicus]|uniref:Uncharacterized protein n=1 Tax=Oryzias javanicus TaxID=123683 RepID=A0A3S2MX32_ORYJA|nr:hypothetical protein OJAV_G00009950 [Oryzias javanicus]